MIIQGSDINPGALAGVKSLADLKKLNIFPHLPNADEAYEELWNKIKPDEQEKKPGSKSKIPELKPTDEPD